MRNASVIVHAILAIGGLLLCYLVWTDTGPEVSESEVTLFECDPDALSRAELHEERKDVLLEVRRQGGEQTIWVTVTRRPETGEPTTERFVGSSDAREYLSKIAPLRAVRSLGELSSAQLGELELAEPSSRLELRCGDRSGSFSLGARSYGTGDRYVRTQGRGPVYLVASDRLQGLESAELRLMQRELHTFERREIVGLRLRGAGRERRLLQHNRLDEARAEWVDAADPERRNELYGNWLVRFDRLRVQSYLTESARPGADLQGMSAAPQDVLRIDYEGEGNRTLGFVELARVDAD
ncbi:MAG: DUF4340 domain-containing protein, partial [Sandaracinaceae bacterium]|nr:DUF4340 domain-containing protein [Sandaracinaceae bacterium]